MEIRRDFALAWFCVDTEIWGGYCHASAIATWYIVRTYMNNNTIPTTNNNMNILAVVFDAANAGNYDDDKCANDFVSCESNFNPHVLRRR